MPALWLAGGGLLLNAFGAYESGQNSAAAQKASAKTAAANAAAATFNAQIAEQNAAIQREQEKTAVEAQQRTAARVMGSIVAGYGASGVQSDNGSPMDVLADSARTAELDKLTIQYNYELKARDYENQAALDRMNAANGMAASTTYASSAGNYSTAGTLNAVGAGLTGLANIMRMG